MKNFNKIGIALLMGFLGHALSYAGSPTEMLAFSMPDGNGGMKLASRSDSKKDWRSIGNFHSFLGSDYGAWGSGKKMHNVRIGQDSDGLFWILFNPDKEGEVVAFTSSPDLEHWKPQEYRRSDSDYLKELPSSLVFSSIVDASVQGKDVKGSVITVDSDLIGRLDGYVHYQSLKSAKNDERADQDTWRFKGLKPLKATVTLDKSGAKPISDEFIGKYDYCRHYFFSFVTKFFRYNQQPYSQRPL